MAVSSSRSGPHSQVSLTEPAADAGPLLPRRRATHHLRHRW